MPGTSAGGSLRASGVVSLVGAGPGDPGLLTVRAVDRLKMANVVYYDGLVPDAVVRLAESAERVSVARRAGLKTMSQAEVADLMIGAARAGRRVVRLKAGDPFLLGRGGEEALALAAARVPFEIVPGVTTALAGPALAGIPVTHRGVASGVVIVSGHAPDAYAGLLGSLAPDSATVVVLMGVAGRRGVAACLIGAGWKAGTPAAIVLNASQADQQVWIGTLGTIDTAAAAVDRDDPGVIVIGQVVTLAASLELARPFAFEEAPWQPTTIPRH